MNSSASINQRKTSFSWENVIAALLILLGALLRIRQYLTGRSLWADEAMLALNIVNRGFAGLFQPLDYDQGAPIGFLLVEKIFNSILGKNELALRLFPLIVGLLSLWLFYLLLKQITSGFGLLTALALFAFNPRLIYYSSEVKQYILDVAVTILLLLIAAPVFSTSPQKKDFVPLTLAGLITLWFSHPALFVLAGIGLALIIVYLRRRDYSNLWVVIGMGLLWGLDIAFLYLLILKDLSQNTYMREYWQGAFLPMPPWSDPGWFVRNLNENIGIQFGIPYAIFFVFLIMLIGWVVLLFTNHLNNSLPSLRGGLRRESVARSVPTKQSHVRFAINEFRVRLLRRFTPRNDESEDIFETASSNQCYAIAFACSLFATLTASALGLYPVFERMILFLVPVGLILIGNAIGAFYQRVQKHQFLSVLSTSVLAGFLIYGPLVTSVQNFVEPKYFEHIRPTMEYLRASWKDGDAMYVSYGALPAFRFYAPFYGLENVHYELGRREDYQNPGDILRQLDSYKGQPRMWILLSHVHEKGDFNERDFILNYLNQIGEKRREFRVPGTSVFLYLYDLGN
jgi:hypothetical protein